MSAADFLDRLLIEGERVDARVDGRLLSASITRTYDGAASIHMVLNDHDFKLIESGLLSKPGESTKKQAKIDDFDQAAWARFGSSLLVYDGWRTCLAGLELNYDATNRTLSLTFEDEAAALMRKQTRPYSFKRATSAGGGGGTMAQFINQLMNIAYRGHGHGHFYSPEETVVQDVKKPDVKEYEKGFAKHARLLIKDVPASAAQRHNLEVALGVADDLVAPELAVEAMLCAGIGESGWRDVMNAEQGAPVPVNAFLADPSGHGGDAVTSGYGGVLQGQVIYHESNWFGGMKTDKRTAEQARSFLQGGRGYQGGGAMAIVRQNPSMHPGEIAIKVEGATPPDGVHHYSQWLDEAERILDAWGGISQTQVIQHRGKYRAGGKVRGNQHNYWDDAGDLADTVRWRLFADLNVLYLLSDNWLFQRRPVIRIDQGLLSGGLFSIGTPESIDVGIPIAELEVVANVADWSTPPGATVEVADLGPLDGRWLVAQSVEDKLRDQATLTLHRPQPKLKEPSGPIRTVTSAPGKGGGSMRDACQKIHRQRRSYPHPDVHHGVFTSFTRSTPLDCSESTCYALWLAGLYHGTQAIVSGDFGSITKSGPGDEFTIYYNAEHVFVKFADGVEFNTAGHPSVSGPRLGRFNYPTAGFNVGHIEGH